MWLKALSLGLVGSLTMASAASATVYKLDIVDGAKTQIDYIGTPFTPHVGCNGCTGDQSWGFGVNKVKGGGWLDFNVVDDGYLFQTEGGQQGNVYFTTLNPFYLLTGTPSTYNLSILTSSRTPVAYAMTDGGTLYVSAVPEPASWLMMILGFVGLGFFGYGRTKKSGLQTSEA